ncbi:ABC transporter B member 29 [Ranunculus cassubicifolius]
MSTIRLTTKSPYTLLSLPNSKLKFHNTNHLSLRNKFSIKTHQISCKKSPSIDPIISSNPRKSLQNPFSLPSLEPIKPFVISEWNPILKGWICSVISVYCLSNVVPKVGNFSSILSKINANKLIEEGLVLGVLVLVQFVATYWQQAFLWEAALKCAYKIRVYVFEKVLKRDLGFFEGGSGVSSGDIAYRVTAEAEDVADTVYALLNTVLPSTLQFIAMATQMVLLSPVLTLISALVIPCISLVVAYLGERLRKISKKAHLSVAKLSEYLNEVLPSILFVKANNAELCECARFQRLAHADLSENLKKKRMKAFIPQIVHAIYVGVLLLLCVGSLVVLRSFFDGSGVISFLTSLFLLVEPIQGLGKAYNELKQGEPAIERLFSLTKFTPKVIEKPDAVDLDFVTGDVKFCNISFKYTDMTPFVISKLNLHVKPGETIALVGPSGGGKTTLTKLLLRLYDPSSGSILIDDCDIQKMRLKSLRRHVGLVSQDIVSKTYHLNLIIDGLAIARAIYQNSSILILDEATSALDSRSEMLVREAVKRLMEKHTVLVIAHRLDTILMADRIFSLENGKLEEISHTSLITNNGSPNGSVVSSGIVI